VRFINKGLVIVTNLGVSYKNGVFKSTTELFALKVYFQLLI